MAKKRASGRTVKRAGDREALEDALWAAPPAAFVAERKRVAAAIAAAGDHEEARAVAKRKRPSASVWAVNQLARRQPDAIAELLALGASLRAGERALLRGGGSSEFLDEARTARQKVAALARRAEALVAESGQKATVAIGRKIAHTLQAAILADEQTRARLQDGRLEHDLTPPSAFGATGGAMSAAVAAGSSGRTSAREPKPRPSREPKPRPSREPKPRPSREPKRAADRVHAVAERAHAASERKRAAAERKRAAAAVRAQRRARAAERKHAATLARAAAAADRTVAERARAVDKARAAVEHAEADLRAAKDALADAELAAAAAHRAVDATAS